MKETLALFPELTSLTDMQARLEHICKAPASEGSVELIVRRPGINQRELLDHATLDKVSGLAGDNWLARGNRKQPGGIAHPDMQLNLMNVRSIAAITQSRAQWPLAGDQFFVDLDLSNSNLPAGSRLRIGTAVIEVTAEPHLGCKKFAERFGQQAVAFVNSATGKALNLRGINARIVEGGTVSPGDHITVLSRLETN